jgi:hypothetical protein
MGEVRVNVKPRDEIDFEKLGLALLAIAESLPAKEQDCLAAEGAVIAERLNLYPKRARRPKVSAA